MKPGDAPGGRRWVGRPDALATGDDGGEFCNWGLGWGWGEDINLFG